MKCNSCGAENEQGRRFCENCGNPLAFPISTVPKNYRNLLDKVQNWLIETGHWGQECLDQINQEVKSIKTPENARLVEKEIRQHIRELEVKKRELDQMTLEQENRFNNIDLHLQSALGEAHESQVRARKATFLGIDKDIVLMKRYLVEIEKWIQTQTNQHTSKFPAVPLAGVKREEPVKGQSAVSGEAEQQSLEELMNELNSMVGLEAVKTDVAGLINFLKVQQLRKSKGLATAPISLHHVFYGNPGTGKTTVARLLSQIFKSMNLLSKGHLVETDRSGLVAGYVGQTALKVTEVVSKALGGILFIDEAYSLAGQGNDFGQEAIETLLKQMEDHRDDLVVIVAGYPDRMNEFLSSNPGLRSRFNRYLRFEDYAPSQLVSIFELFCDKSGYQILLTAREKLQSVFNVAYNKRDKTFGNARFARNLFERTISNQANRVVALPDASPQIFSTIDIADIPDKAMDDLS